MHIAIFWLFILLIVAMFILGAIAAKKRREALATLAMRLGLNYSAEKDYSLDDRYGFLDALARGSNRYAYNVLKGTYRGQTMMVFDYHYETHSTDSKGRRQTHHHHFSCFILTLPKNFPELRITQEGFLSRVAQAFGYDDIDFESAEFSRAFCVRSTDKKFAYDICNPAMIEYLLANRDLSIEVEADALALAFGRCLDAAEIEKNLDRLCEVRSRFPNYLFTQI